MSLFIKICGLTTTETVEAAVEAGADAIGFVFAESPRKVSLNQAVGLARQLPEKVIRVAVMHHPTQKEWAEVARVFGPQWIQTDMEDFAVLDTGSEVRRLPVYRDQLTFDARAISQEDLVLFEPMNSGKGQQADWHKAEVLARTTRLVLAGGLNPQNVASAIKQVRPWGVDVSSGVESSRGVKDPERISAFISAARNVELNDAG
jgi:phosphoribosylanthranilate isomerase